MDKCKYCKERSVKTIESKYAIHKICKNSGCRWIIVESESNYSDDD